MQEEVNEKTISLCIKGGKITAQILKAALIKLLAEMEKKKQQVKGEKSQCKKTGRQSIKSLQKSGAQITNIVVTDNITFGSDGRARGWVTHFDGTASLLVHPIQIGLGVWNFRLNLKNVCTDGIRQIFGNFCGDTAGRKVGDKSFAHGNALPLDDFV